MAEQHGRDNTVVWNPCNNNCSIASTTSVRFSFDMQNFAVEHLANISACMQMYYCTSQLLLASEAKFCYEQRRARTET